MQQFMSPMRTLHGASQEHKSISIQIPNHVPGKVYTTGSHIHGSVTFRPLTNIPPSCLEICLEGISKTRIDGLVGPRKLHRAFLRLEIPVDKSSSLLCSAAQTYTLPFEFVIPAYLPTHACDQTRGGAPRAVQDYHLQLPPSMGLCGGKDGAPDTAKIVYQIRATIRRPSGPRVAHRECLHEINVLPSTPEDPPLPITPDDEQYTLIESRTLHSRFPATPKGQISASAFQPSAILLGVNGSQLTVPRVTVNLLFSPSSRDIKPPTIQSVDAHVEAFTWFGIVPQKTLPNLGSLEEQYKSFTGASYTSRSRLLSKTPQTTPWCKTTEPSPKYEAEEELEDDASSGAANLCGSVDASGSPAFVASCSIPLQLPVSRKRWIPTFHSCFVTRVYKLKVKVKAGNSALALTIPVQICVVEAA